MIETVAWLLATLVAPGVMRVWRARWPASTLGRSLQAWARLGYGVLPLYGAWVSGSIVARDAGLRWGPPERSLAGLAAGVLLLGLTAAASRHEAAGERLRGWWLGEPGWWPLADEPRWAFYRAAAAVFVPMLLPAQLLGLALGVVEWGVRRGRVTPFEGRARAEIVRLGVSAGLFALSGNLLLVIATAAGVRALLLRTRA